MKKILAIALLFALSSPAHAVTRLYDRNAGDIIDADRDDAEWDNTNNAINVHEAATSAHGVTGNIVGTAGVQTLTGPKTLVSPIITSAPTAAGATWVDLGAVTTVDINGGSIDGTVIGASAATDGTFGDLDASSGQFNRLQASDYRGGFTSVGLTNNCGFSVSGSTLTIAGEDGTALSITNPCTIGIKSTTAGRTVLARFQSNVTFTFGPTSDTDGNFFGVDSSADWSSPMPFFLGVIYNGTTPYFVISRVPTVVSGSLVSMLCQKGDTSCEATEDSMILGTGVTLSQYLNRPITQVGWFQMTYATADTSWTASTSVANGTGFNQEYEKIGWTFPLGVFTGHTDSYFVALSGGSPAFSLNFYTYYVSRDGFCRIVVEMSGDGGADGLSSDTATLALPFAILNTPGNHGAASAWIRLPSSEYHAMYEKSGQYFSRPSLSGSSLQSSLIPFQLLHFPNGFRSVSLDTSYKIRIDL